MFFFFGTGIPIPVSLALLIGPYLVPTLLGGGLSFEDVNYYTGIGFQKVRNVAYRFYEVIYVGGGEPPTIGEYVWTFLLGIVLLHFALVAFASTLAALLQFVCRASGVDLLGNIADDRRQRRARRGRRGRLVEASPPRYWWLPWWPDTTARMAAIDAAADRAINAAAARARGESEGGAYGNSVLEAVSKVPVEDYVPADELWTLSVRDLVTRLRNRGLWEEKPTSASSLPKASTPTSSPSSSSSSSSSYSSSSSSYSSSSSSSAQAKLNNSMALEKADLVGALREHHSYGGNDGSTPVCIICLEEFDDGDESDGNGSSNNGASSEQRRQEQQEQQQEQQEKQQELRHRHRCVVRVLPRCHHVFHLECFDKWAFQQASTAGVREERSRRQQQQQEQRRRRQTERERERERQRRIRGQQEEAVEALLVRASEYVGGAWQQGRRFFGLQEHAPRPPPPQPPHWQQERQQQERNPDDNDAPPPHDVESASFVAVACPLCNTPLL